MGKKPTVLGKCLVHMGSKGLGFANLSSRVSPHPKPETLNPTPEAERV